MVAGLAVCPGQGLEGTSPSPPRPVGNQVSPQEDRAGRGVPITRTLSVAGVVGVGLLEGVLGEVTPRFVGKRDVNQAGSSCKHISLEMENQSLPWHREEWMRGGKGGGHGGRRGQAPRVRATPGTVGDLTPDRSLRPLMSIKQALRTAHSQQGQGKVCPLCLETN